MTTLQRYLPFIIIMISFVACDSLGSFVDDNSPYIDDGGTFKKILKQSTNVLSLKRFDKLGSFSPSPLLKRFNVADYGAEGDGKTDDTQVYIFCFITKQPQINVTSIIINITIFYIFLLA